MLSCTNLCLEYPDGERTKTIFENVITGHSRLSKQVENKAFEVLQRLGLKDHVHKKNHQLSGGERQRVAIARALVNEPDIIFADEPTASLDHSTATEVVSLLKTHKKGSIVIMATHDTSILSGDERVIQLVNSGIKATV